MPAHYRELYEYCQNLTPKISTNDIKAKVLELAGLEKVKIVISGLDIELCRGFYISAANTEHPLIIQNACDIIVVARDLNTCWERFIITKELMHLLDAPNEKTVNPEQYERLLQELQAPMTEPSPQFSSENLAFWMALGCLCPESHRQNFLKLKQSNHINNYEIALKLRIPEQCIPVLLSDAFLSVMTMLRG